MSSWQIIAGALLLGVFWANAYLIAQPYMQWITKPLYSEKSKSTAWLWVLVLMLASIAYFFAQVGLFVDQGFMGMFQWDFIQMIWQSPVGDFACWSVMAAVVWSLSLLVKGVSSIRLILVAGAMLLTANAYLSTGHAVDLAVGYKMILAGHLFIAMLWCGSLIPLLSTLNLPAQQCQGILERFGKHMGIAVPLLLIGGVLLFNGIANRWVPTGEWTDYEWLLLAKVIGVSTMLGLAAAHKLWFVPKLIAANGADYKNKLRRSITIEFLVTLTVILLATVLSNFYSPNH